jgi:hypothetical protein
MWIRHLLAGALAVSLSLLGMGSAFAQEETGQALTAETFTLQPNGRATVNFEAFCNDFGAAFPQNIQLPSAVAQPEVRAAIAHIADEGYAGNNQDALDAQYGLWRVVGATNSPQGGDIAEGVVSAAGGNVPEPQGTSLLDAVQAGQVNVTLDSWQPLGEQVQIGALTDYFHGRGTLTIENTSDQELTLYHPVGVLYAPETAGAQTMVGYATDVSVDNPQPAQQPAQLPDTADGGGMPLAGFALLIGALLVGGLALRRRAL